MAKKLTIKSDETLSTVLGKLTPSWDQVFPKATIEKAQVAKSSSRNYMFGNIMNNKFIKLSKPSAGFKAGDIVSISDIYDDESASNIAGLIIFRLANSGLSKQPTLVEA